MKKKLYISLPISGFPIECVKREVECHRRKWLNKGYDVISPLDLFDDTAQPYSFYMGKDIEVLLECDAVYFAPGWTDSKGCNLEYAAAKIYDKTIFT